MHNLKPGHRAPTVCLDAGHYGKYNPSPVVPGYYESDMNWTLHLLLKAELERRGITVITTRPDQGTDLPLVQRGKAARDADLFLSLHSNAASTEQPDWVVAMHFVDDDCGPIDRQSKELAGLLAQKVAQIMGVSHQIYTQQSAKDRDGNGFKDDYYGVLRGAHSVGTPGVIIEHGFHTNAANTRWLMEEGNLERLAQAEAELIAQWFGMDETARSMSALVVSPYDHGDVPNTAEGIVFPSGQRMEQFGTEYEIDWFDAIRHPGRKPPFECGKVTYYRLFENEWATDAFEPGSRNMTLTLGDHDASYVYNPFDPPSFKGGLSCNFGGSCYQDAPDSRYDIISVYTEPFAEDTFVKGKMSARLTVSSDCEDTCFYVRVSIAEERGDYGLRDDITSLCYQLGDYTPGANVQLDFNFDEHAFLIRRGQRLRVDIASADNAHYVRHTNMKGLYCEQTTARVAHNTVCLAQSTLTLPVEETCDE